MKNDLPGVLPQAAGDAFSSSRSVLRRLGTPVQLAVATLLFLTACAIVPFLNGYYVYVLANIALMAIVGVGLNVLLGLTGQVSFGHVGFYAIGSYTVAILNAAGWSFWVAWPIAALLAGLFGVLLALPALRVKGPYLAMITISFSFIVQHAIIEMNGVTGGQNGMMGIAGPSLSAALSSERVVALLALAATALSLACYAWLASGTWGAAMRAVKDSEVASQSIGLNPLVIKTVAFALSALLAGLAGGLYAPLAGFVTPDSFGFVQSILFVLVVVIGGAGSIAGPLAGALIVGLVPELLSGLEDYRLLFFGALMLLVLWIAPNGVAGSLRRKLPRQPIASKVDHAREAFEIVPAARTRRAKRSLRTDSLSMVFGGVKAVSSLSIDMPPAAVTSLIGPNGAGKTTALNVLSGFYKATAGSFTLGDIPLNRLKAFQIARQGVARTYQTSQLFNSLTAEENVALAVSHGKLGYLLGDTNISSAQIRTLSRQLLATCGYAGHPRALAAGLAHVDRRLVEIARALATGPDVVLLDEPAAGLSSEDKEHLSMLLRRIADSGISVVLVEHDMTLVMEISDHIVVLDAGQKLASGHPTVIRNDPAVRRAYLGEMVGNSLPQARDQRDSQAHAPEVLGVGSLFAGYDAEPVLDGIDLQVRQGQLVALLGANGAGKSTLMRALAGLHRPVRGGIHFEGIDLTRLSASEIVAAGVVLVPEGRQIFPELTVHDNLCLGAFLQRADMGARIDEMLRRFPRLKERLHQRAGLLSGGEQQMLAIARALMSRPRLLLLDEPSLGLAPKIITELFAALDRLREEGMTILLVDQMAALALALADYAYVLEGGHVVAQGSTSKIAADPALAAAYLGMSR